MFQIQCRKFLGFFQNSFKLICDFWMHVYHYIFCLYLLSFFNMDHPRKFFFGSLILFMQCLVVIYTRHSIILNPFYYKRKEIKILGYHF